MDVISALVVAVILAAAGFISHFLRKRQNKLEYFYDALEWLILVTGPLLAGAVAVVDKNEKSLFLAVFIVIIMAWAVFWFVTKKNDEKVRIAEPFVWAAGGTMVSIGIFYWFIIMA